MRFIGKYFLTILRVIFTPYRFASKIDVRDTSFFHRSLNFLFTSTGMSVVIYGILHRMMAPDLEFDDFLTQLLLPLLILLMVFLYWLIAKLAKPATIFSDALVVFSYVGGTYFLLYIVITSLLCSVYLWSSPDVAWFQTAFPQYVSPEATKNWEHPCFMDAAESMSLECRGWIYAKAQQSPVAYVFLATPSLVDLWMGIALLRFTKAALGISYLRFLGAFLLALTVVGPIIVIARRVIRKMRSAQAEQDVAQSA
jgi:hypothetical protein